MLAETRVYCAKTVSILWPEVTAWIMVFLKNKPIIHVHIQNITERKNRQKRSSKRGNTGTTKLEDARKDTRYYGEC